MSLGESAKTTLDNYGHIWPDRDRATVDAVSAARAEERRCGHATAQVKAGVRRYSSQ